MYCVNCGSEIPNGSTFIVVANEKCRGCGRTFDDAYRCNKDNH